MKKFNVVVVTSNVSVLRHAIPCRKIKWIRETPLGTVVIESGCGIFECVESLDDILEQINGETRLRPSAKPKGAWEVSEIGNETCRVDEISNERAES